MLLEHCCWYGLGLKVATKRDVALRFVHIGCVALRRGAVRRRIRCERTLRHRGIVHKIRDFRRQSTSSLFYLGRDNDKSVNCTGVTC